MVDLNFKIEDTSQRVVEAAEKAAVRNHRAAAFAIMQDAKASIKTRPTTLGRGAGGRFKSIGGGEPSPPGKPPYTRRGLIRRAIRYAADQDGAVIGTQASQIGTAGQPHELGGGYKGETYEQRPFMVPALEDNLANIAGQWSGSIGT